MIKHVKDLQVGDVFFCPEMASVFTVVAVGSFYNFTSKVMFQEKTYLVIPLILVRKDGRNFQLAMYDRLIPVIGQSKGVFHAEKV